MTHSKDAEITALKSLLARAADTLENSLPALQKNSVIRLTGYQLIKEIREVLEQNDQ